MQRSFLRCHWLAWMGGTVFAYIGAALLTVIPPKLLLHYPLIGPVLPVFLAVTLVEIFIAWRLAILLGAFDALLAIGFTLTLALGFGFSYSQDVHLFLPNDGHTMFSIATYGAQPFDFPGQSEIFSLIFIWVLSVLCVATALKRMRHPESASAPHEGKKLYRWLAFDLVLIVCATVTVLRIEVVDRIAEGKPENITRAAAFMMQSKDSPPGDRTQAVFAVAKVNTDEATDLLRHAAREEPLNLVAAAELLGRDDMLGLSILKDHLMHTTQVAATYSGTRKTMMGESVTGYHYQFNLQSNLAHVKDPAALPILIELMHAPEPETRRAAIQGMRNIKPSPLTVDALTLGLYDSDATVQFYAICGLILILDRDKATYGWERPSHHFVSRQDDLDSLKAWASQRNPGTAHPLIKPGGV